MPDADLPPPLHGVAHAMAGPPGRRLHVALAGPADGPAIVLLHGWPQHWWIWRDVIGPLADDGWRVVAVDQLGAGWSDVPDQRYLKTNLASAIVDALDELGVDRFHLAGHDWGGWVAQLIAVDHPDRVAALTVLNIAALWTDRRPPLRRLIRLAYQPLVALPALGPALQRSGPFWRAMARNGIPPEALASYRRQLADPRRAEAGSRLYRDFLRRELRQGPPARAIAAPASILFGLDDPVLDLAMAEPLADHVPSLEVATVEGCGHFVVDERPDRVRDHLLAFHGRHRDVPAPDPSSARERAEPPFGSSP